MTDGVTVRPSSIDMPKVLWPEEEQARKATMTEAATAEVHDPNVAPTIVPVLFSAALSALSLTLAVVLFRDAADDRDNAEMINDGLVQHTGTHPCSAVARLQACATMDALNVNADVRVGLGMGALVATGGGFLMIAQQLLWDTSSPTKKPSSQVALTKVPGGGALMVVGTF